MAWEPHKTAAAVAGVVVFVVAVCTAMAPAVAAARRVPVGASAGENVTPEDDRMLDAIDMCFEKALNASSSVAVADKFPLFEATLDKSLRELNDKKFVPKVETASMVASKAAAAATSPDEKFAVYFARLTQVLVGTVDAEKHAAAEKEATAAAGTQPAAAAAAADTQPATAAGAA